MIIRTERPEEFDEIYELVKEAFKTAKVSGGDEQNYVDRLRDSGNYIPSLAFVAEKDGKLIGHIMLTKTQIIDNDKVYETLLLSPVSVALEYRNQKVGTKMIKEGFLRAKEMGYRSAVLVGDIGYYGRFGFKQSTQYGIKNTNGIPDEHVMACEIVPGGLDDISGEIYFME